MNINKIVNITLAVVIIIVIIGIILFFVNDKIKENEEDKVAVTFIENLNVEFGSKIKVSDFIQNINGTLLTDSEIETTSLGTKNVEFTYKSVRNKEKKKSFQINVVDTTKPKIFMTSNTLTVNVGYNKNLTEVFLSGDDCDSSPTREIIGDYDFNTAGNYDLTFKIIDASGNYETRNFTLIVKESTSSGTKTSTQTTSKIKFDDCISKYKNSNTMLGIDVSEWQSEIDWQTVKESGCEFAFIRVGYQKGFNGENVLDKYFERNIKGATEQGIKVGAYFYTYAKTVEEASSQAEYVLDKLKGYNVTLPVAFDWESWESFVSCNLSFYDINNLAKTFINRIEEGSLTGSLYSSKNYLQKIWYADEYENVWLAHYTKQTDYEGSYNAWQMCNTGRISGINGDVDIDIIY